MVQAASCRHSEQRAHFSGAARLPEDRHVVGIAAERGDVVADPLQAEHDVLQAHVARVTIAIAADLLEIEESEAFNRCVMLTTTTSRVRARLAPSYGLAAGEPPV
jgi:hypothetical protein